MTTGEWIVILLFVGYGLTMASLGIVMIVCAVKKTNIRKIK